MPHVETKLEQWANVPREDVPYVAAWSEERDLRIGQCRFARGPAVMRIQRPGRGVPILGKMDEQRQRECMALRLCQVCHLPVGAPAYAIESPAECRLPDRMIPMPLILEPLACVECARKALAICPGLARAREAGTLRCFEVRDYLLIAQYVGPAGNNDALDRALRRWKGDAPVGYLKGALTDYTLRTEAQVFAISH